MAFPVSPLNGATTTVNGITYTYASVTNSWTRVVANDLAITGNISGNNITANSISTTGKITILNTGDVSANIGTISTSLQTLNANVGAYEIYANANIGTISTSLQTLNANVGAYEIYANTKIGTNTNSNLVVLSATASSSTTTGALVIGGGVGIAGNVFTAGWIVPTGNVTQNLGSSTQWWNLVYGRSVQAQYADLAENYQADATYAAGTVLVFGGDHEVTVTDVSHDTRVAGVVSTNPAYLMNAENGNVAVALTGRVPCRVRGPVEKGTVLVTSHIHGVAEAISSSMYRPGCIVGKALERIPNMDIQTIEVVVGRF